MKITPIIKFTGALQLIGLKVRNFGVKDAPYHICSAIRMSP